MSQSYVFKQSLRRGLFAGSFVLVLPFALLAQEATSPPESPTTGSAQTQPTGRPYLHHKGEHIQMPHPQMEAMCREMDTELQQQLTALREHTQTMATITDNQQLVEEMKKHQQSTDALLGALIEQRQKMHAMMHAQGGHIAAPGCCPMEQKESHVPRP
jgi:hypothetical protein